MAKYLDRDGLEHFWTGVKTVIGTKADKSATVSTVAYDETNKKLTKTINGSTTNIVTVQKLKQDFELTKADVGLDKVDNTPDLEKNVAGAKTATALVSDTVRPTSANEMHNNDKYRVRAFLASASMTSGKPPVNSHMLHFNWDTGTSQTGTSDSQIAVSSGGLPGLYIRTQNSGTWSDWVELYSSVNPPSASVTGLNNVKNLTQKALHGGTALASRTNLNTKTDIGNYYATGSVAASLTNCPVNVAFHMYVGLSDGVTAGYEYQEIICAEDGNRYYRRHNGPDSTEWTDWQELAPYTAGTGLGLAERAFYTAAAQNSGTSKRVTELGKSKYIIEEFASGSEGLPTETNSYFVLTATGNNVRYGVQLAMNENADGVFYRRLSNSVYCSWLPLTFKADGNGLTLVDNKFRNVGVWSVEEGTENGKIKVNTNGTAEQIAVHGLGTNAFSSVAYLPLTGGTLTGNVTASKVGQIGFYVENTYEANAHKAALLAASNGNTGIYDSTNSKWIAYSDKSGNVTLNGKANSATEFAEAKSVTLTGDVTGTASSKAGWSVAATLADTAVTAGSYGPASGLTLGFGDSFAVPYYQVDSKGRLVSSSTKTMTLPSLANSGVTAGTFGPTQNATLSHSGTFTVPYFNVDEKGRITNAVNRTLTLPAFDDTGVTAGYYGQSSNASPAHGGTFSIPYIRVNAKGQIVSAVTRTITLPEDQNTQYTAGDGLSLINNEFKNTGVRTLDLVTGTSDGTIGYKINGAAAIDVSVKGLKTAAYKDISFFAEAGHTHSYAGSASAGGAANSVAKSLILRVKSGTTEGTDQYTFDGSAAKVLNIKQGANVTLTAGSKTLTIAANDTTYTAGTGLSLSSDNKFSLASGVVTAGSAGPTAAVTGNDGSKIAVPQITVDTYGRVTALTSYEYTSVNTNTTYSAGDGIALNSGVFSNTGVRSVTTGDNNGTIRVDTNGSSVNVPVKGLGSAAYTSSTAYAAASHSHVVRSSGTISVSTSSWGSTSDSSISGTYPYQASFTLSGATASMMPEVVFKPSDALTYDLAPICKTYAGGIYIYAKTKPTSTITVLSAACF